MLNDRKLDVLNILYKKGEPMMVTDIINTAKGDLTQSTVTAVLRKLLRMGMVEVTGVEHSGKVLSRLYVPAEKAKEMILKHFLFLYRKFKNVVPADEICKAIREMEEMKV